MSCRLRIREEVDDFIAGHNAYVRSRRQPGLSPFAPPGSSFGFREGWDCALGSYGPPPPPEERVDLPVVTKFVFMDAEIFVAKSAKEITAQSWKMATKDGLDLEKFGEWLLSNQVDPVDGCTILVMELR